MKRFRLLLICLSAIAECTIAQTVSDTLGHPVKDSLLLQDSIAAKDSLQQMQAGDSVSKMPHKETGWKWDDSLLFSFQDLNWQLLKRNPYFGFSVPASGIHSSVRQISSKDLIFYFLVALLLVCAFLKNSFPKYFNDLFRLFFRTTLKQRQIREQLMQTPLPSLLLNGFFVVSAGLYVTFLLQYFKLDPLDNFWLLFFYCCLGLSAIYLVKFLGLKLSGWLFNMKEMADSYIFIVFIINKMIGLFLLPFLVLLAFAQGDIYDSALTLSWFLTGGLIIYRFILTFVAIRNQVKVNPFHFFLYLCAFEIAPLLLIYKGLLLFFRITA